MYEYLLALVRLGAGAVLGVAARQAARCNNTTPMLKNIYKVTMYLSTIYTKCVCVTFASFAQGRARMHKSLIFLIQTECSGSRGEGK